jgi:hypothetical protein
MPCRLLADATVRDNHGGGCGSAASGGDVSGADDVAMPVLPTAWACELSAFGFLSHPTDNNAPKVAGNGTSVGPA